MTRTLHTAAAREATLQVALAHVVINLDAQKSGDMAVCHSVPAQRKRFPTLFAVPAAWMDILRAFGGLSMLTAAALLLL